MGAEEHIMSAVLDTESRDYTHRWMSSPRRIDSLDELLCAHWYQCILWMSRPGRLSALKANDSSWKCISSSFAQIHSIREGTTNAKRHPAMLHHAQSI